MADCLVTLGGIAHDCSANMGGVKEVYIANKADVTAVTITSDVVSTITMAQTKKFKGYYFRKGSASLTSTWTKDASTGVAYVTSVLTMNFSKMETAKRVEVNALALGRLVVIVRDNNDKYWLLGKDDAVEASAGDGQTGTAMGDANRYSTSLQDVSQVLPYEVKADIVSGLVG